LRKQATIVAAALAGVLFVPGLARAQAQKGDGEVLVQGFAFSIFGTDYTSTSANAQFDLGRFVSDKVELGFGPTLTISSSRSPGMDPIYDSRGRVLVPGIPSETSTKATVGGHVFGKVFFGSGKVYPFIGLDFAISDFKAPEGGSFADNLSLGPSVGVKNYLTEKTALTLEGATTVSTQSSGSKNLFLRVGISHLF
jgi:hypothetical protein